MAGRRRRGAALVGTIFMVGDWWYEAFAVPWIADVAPWSSKPVPAAASFSEACKLRLVLARLGAVRCGQHPRSGLSARELGGSPDRWRPGWYSGQGRLPVRQRHHRSGDRVAGSVAPEAGVGRQQATRPWPSESRRDRATGWPGARSARPLAARALQHAGDCPRPTRGRVCPCLEFRGIPDVRSRPARDSFDIENNRRFSDERDDMAYSSPRNTHAARNERRPRPRRASGKRRRRRMSIRGLAGRSHMAMDRPRGDQLGWPAGHPDPANYTIEFLMTAP